jgi:hypothetical protein
MNIRPIESWIWSRIKLGKEKDSARYYTDITADEFEVKMNAFQSKLNSLFAESKELENEIQKQLKGLRYE